MALTTIDDRGLKTPIDLLDNEKIRFGTGNDLELFHDGASRITHTGAGNLVISTTATDSDLYLRGKDKVVIQPADGEDGVICNANGSVELYNDGSKKLETTSSGVQITDNLGIGVAPSRELHVKGLDGTIRLESTAATGRTWIEFFDTSAIKGSIGYPSSGNDNLAIQQSENADMYFTTNDTERLRINSSGFIAHHDSNIVAGGFGYHGWSGKTQILDSQGLAVFRADDAWGGSIQLASSRGNYASASASLAGDRIGGIYFCAHDGTDLNNYTAAVESYVTGTVASNATPGYLAFSTAAAGSNQLTERLRIDPSGNVGIGNNNPDQKLKIEDSNNFAIHLLKTGSQDTLIQNTGQTEICAATGGASGQRIVFRIGANTGSMPEIARFTPDGLCFGSDTAAANALDDYEEGTWTPTLTQTAGVTLTNNESNYTKIGRMVHAQTYVQWIGTASVPGSTFRIGGLPFTSKSGLNFGHNTILFGDDFTFTNLRPLVSPGQQYLYFHFSSGTGNTANNGHMVPDTGTHYMILGLSYYAA